MLPSRHAALLCLLTAAMAAAGDAPAEGAGDAPASAPATAPAVVKMREIPSVLHGTYHHFTERAKPKKDEPKREVKDPSFAIRAKVIVVYEVIKTKHAGANFRDDKHGRALDGFKTTAGDPIVEARTYRVSEVQEPVEGKDGRSWIVITSNERSERVPMRVTVNAAGVMNLTWARQGKKMSLSGVPKA